MSGSARSLLGLACFSLALAASVSAPADDLSPIRLTPPFPVKPMGRDSFAKTIAHLDRLNLRRGQKVDLPSGRVATVFAFIHFEDEKDHTISPFLILQEPRLEQDLTDWSNERETRILADMHDLCRRYGERLLAISRDVFPVKADTRLILRFRDKPSVENGFQWVYRYGGIFDLSDGECIHQRP